MSSYSTNPTQSAANKFNEFGGASTVTARIMAQQAGNPSAWRDYMKPTAAQTKPLWTPTPEATTPAMPAANPLFSAGELSNIASLNQRDAALQTPKSFSFSGMQGQMPGDIAAKAAQNQPVAAAPQTAMSSTVYMPNASPSVGGGMAAPRPGFGTNPNSNKDMSAGFFVPGGNSNTPIPQQSTGAVGGIPAASAPMDAAAIQKYAADQVAAKLAAAMNSANQARTSAQGDAAQSTSLLDNQLAQAVARLQASAQQAQQGVQTGYERANAITKDNRVLSDSSFQRNTNPFSGATSYKEGLIGREREISDRQSQEDYNSRLGSINQDAMNQQGAIEQDIGASKAGIQQGLSNLQNKITTDLQNLETSSGAEKERLIREITADERQYAMAMRGENRQDVLANATLAQQKFQQDMDTFKTNYGITKDNRDYNYQVGRDVKTDFNSDRAYNYGVNRDTKNDAINANNTAYNRGQDQLKNEANKTAAERQSRVDNWNAYMQSVGLTGNLGSGAKADWSLLGGTDGEPTAEAKAKYLTQEGTRLNNELAQLQLDNYPQEQKLKIQQLQKQIDQIGRAPYQSATDAEYDKIKLDTAKEQLSQLRNKPNETKPLTASSYKTNPDFADEIATIQANPGNALAKIQEHAQALVQAYGYDGYQELVRAATPKQ